MFEKIILSFIYHALLLPHKVVLLSQFFIKLIISFWDMPTICPKIFPKLDFFTAMSQIGLAYFALEVFWTFMTFSRLCLSYPVLKIWENWKKKHNFFRVKDNLAVLPSGHKFSGHNILITFYHLKEKQLCRIMQNLYPYKSKMVLHLFFSHK